MEPIEERPMLNRRLLVPLGLACLCTLSGCRASTHVHSYSAGSRGDTAAADRFGARMALASTSRQIAAGAQTSGPTLTDAQPAH
jgi:hypothetical protein